MSLDRQLRTQRARSSDGPDVRGILAALAVSLVSVAYIAAGVAWPHAAGSLLRLLVLTLAVMYAAAEASRALQHIGAERKRYSPFDGGAQASRAPSAPQSLRSLTAQLGAADSETDAVRVLIPWSVLATLLAEVRRRLAEHHGLDPATAAHLPRIRSLVSAPTLELLAARDDVRNPDEVNLTMDQLPHILDDVERL